MNLTDQQLKQILLAGNYIEEQEMEFAIKNCQSRHLSLYDYLIESGAVTEELVGQAIAEFFRIAYADLQAQRPPTEQVTRIPEEAARKYHLVLFSETDDQITIATDMLENLKILKDLQILFPSKRVALAYALPHFVEEILDESFRKILATRFSQIIAEQKQIAPEIVSEIFNDASIFKASDIHFEPQKKDVVIVRFRVDGVLQEAGRLPKEYYENIINRLKVQAHLRIDEHQAAQDGAIHFTDDKRTIDARMSIMPTINGEKIVLRLLAEYIRSFTLVELGFSKEDQKLLETAAHKPFGMILVSGPTGSGKSTTLYGVLKTLNDSKINITTIEDPIEMEIEGVNQIQVNAATGLTFAKGLRSIVRQDPNVILVGEIRDFETAEIAVNAALTGHLLLSTFHANDSATAIPRLIEMGIEPFLLSSTLELIISQRLVRRICESCRYSITFTHDDIEKNYPKIGRYFPEKVSTFYAGKGCSVCSGTGFKGRVGIFELISANKELRDLILSNPSSQQIQELARRNGTKSMFEDGVEKVRLGMTTIDELLRVANPPEDDKK
jgi:type II secretory ATPase GspE/PulE/Tfp pilus assembly ATPase PilB-like protein